MSPIMSREVGKCYPASVLPLSNLEQSKNYSGLVLCDNCESAACRFRYLFDSVDRWLKKTSS